MKKEKYLFPVLSILLIFVSIIFFFLAIFKINSGYGNPFLTNLWEKIIKETPQAKVSEYLRSVVDNNEKKALNAWKLQEANNFQLLTQRREGVTKDLIAQRITSFEILKTEWWRTCCDPGVTFNAADAGGARIVVQLTSQNNTVFNYIFDVFHRQTIYGGATEGYRPRHWVLRDVYPEGETPLFWTVKSSESVTYVSSYSPLRPGIDYKLEIPSSWRGKYEVEETEDYSDFIYSGNPKQKHSLFKIFTLKKDEWEQKNKSGYHGKEIGSRGNVIFVLSRSLGNPFAGKYAEEYQKMEGEIDAIIKTFTILP